MFASTVRSILYFNWSDEDQNLERAVQESQAGVKAAANRFEKTIADLLNENDRVTGRPRNG